MGGNLGQARTSGRPPHVDFGWAIQGISQVNDRLVCVVFYLQAGPFVGDSLYDRDGS